MQSCLIVDGKFKFSTAEADKMRKTTKTHENIENVGIFQVVFTFTQNKIGCIAISKQITSNTGINILLLSTLSFTHA